MKRESPVQGDDGQRRTHTYPGTVLISVTESDVVVLCGMDCARRDYSAGTAPFDPGDTVHTARKPSAEGATVVVAHFGVRAKLRAPAR